MFRDRVVEHYRQRGYRIHENVKVRGASGAVHACDVVAQGPLGNLIVSFGDASGVEGPELAAMRRTARDVGATAVVAVPEASRGVEEAARRHGVKILDDKQLVAYEPVNVDEVRPEAEDHPWPEQEPRLRKAAARSDDEATQLWKHPRKASAPTEKPRADGFAWLGGDGPAAKDMGRTDGAYEREGPGDRPSEAPTRTQSMMEAPVQRARDAPRPAANAAPPSPEGRRQRPPSATPAASRPTRPSPAWRWIVAPILWGVATGATFFFLSLLV